MSTDPQLILYIAMSLDGYIARTDDDLSWLDAMQLDGEDYGYQEFMQTIDTVILGRKTYDKVKSMGVEFPHADKQCFVITRTPQSSIGTTHFYTENLSSLVVELKKGQGKNIFCDGGAEIINALLQNHMIDEYIISIIPIFLGSGIRLFKDNRPEQVLQLVSAKTYLSGLVQLHYKKLI